jgi:hypothetical protein
MNITSIIFKSRRSLADIRAAPYSIDAPDVFANDFFLVGRSFGGDSALIFFCFTFVGDFGFFGFLELGNC